MGEIIEQEKKELKNFLNSSNRREFLRTIAAGGLGLLILGDRIDHEAPPVIRSQEKAGPGIITKKALTPVQKLTLRIEPPGYDQEKVHRFYRRNHPGSERFIPIIFEACKRYENIHPVDEVWVGSMTTQESSWNPFAISEPGAAGLIQIMPYTGEEMGMENVYYPEYYKEARKKHKEARELFGKAESFRNLFYREVNSDLNKVLRKLRKGVNDLSEEEKWEIKAELYRKWTGLEGLEASMSYISDETGGLVLDLYNNLKGSIENLNKGLLEMMTNLKTDRFRETYEDVPDRLKELSDKVLDLNEEYSQLFEKMISRKNAMDRLFDSAIYERAGGERMEKVSEGYRKYRRELRSMKSESRFKPEENMHKGVKYLALLLREFGNIMYATCAFNCGKGEVYTYRKNPKTGKYIKIPKMPFIRQTIGYVDKVFKNFNHTYPEVV